MNNNRDTQSDNQIGSELVLGIINTIGTDTKKVISHIKSTLEDFSYNVIEIKVSDEIISQFSKDNPKFKKNELYQRISYYMDLGNRARRDSQDNSILMKGVAKYIYEKREDVDDGNEEHKILLEKKPSNKTAYIVKSLKHPDEVNFMRNTYGEGFHLIALTGSYSERYDYLVRKRLSKEQSIELLNRDGK